MVDDGRTDDGRMPDHGHPISSPCEPNGSGELIKALAQTLSKILHKRFSHFVFKGEISQKRAITQT